MAVSTEDCLVHIVDGTLGSGKSYYVQLRMMEALMRGEVVVTNIRFVWPAVEAYCKSQGFKNPIPVGNYRYFETDSVKGDIDALLKLLCKRSMLVIDEVHLLMDSRDWRENKEQASAFQLLMTQARKFKVDMWFLAQSFQNIDNRIQRQATHIIRCLNWRHFPVLGNIFRIPLTIARICGKDGRTVHGKEWILRKSSVFRCYDSSQAFLGLQLEGEEPIPVQGARKRTLSYGWILMMVGMTLVGLDWYFKRDKKPEVAKAEAKPEKPARKVMYEEAPTPAVREVQPVQPIRLERDLMTRFESNLPRLVKVAPFALICENRTLRPRDTLGLGRIISWRVEGDGATVLTDSPEMPEIRLFHARNPFLSTTLGAPIRRGSWLSPSGIAPGNDGVNRVAEVGVIKMPAGMPQRVPAASVPMSVDEVPHVESPPALQHPAPYQPRPAFVPPVTYAQ